ncbi:two-component system response regulator [bacterium M21]|nr:two-component system response regulator [bacterium M21]
MAKVLIVDDALFMRRMIRNALEPLGFEIVGEASNGVEGLQMFNELSPDITTLDIVMPEMDGIETLEKIREQSPDAKIIMITAVDQRDSMLQAMKLGVSDFVVKPFDEDRIISAAEKALGRTLTA